MTFVENEFKHVAKDPELRPVIDIELSLDEQLLDFTVINIIASETENIVGGIGLKSVQRRLELVYPDQHLLTVNKTNALYTVTLQLALTEMVQSQVPEITYLSR